MVSVMRLVVIAQHEWFRLFATKRGLISMVGFLLLWVGVLNYALLPAAAFFSGAVESGLIDLLLPQSALQAWQQWLAPELAVYWAISLFIFPALAVVTSADQTASDRTRGTLRYWSLRCSRMDIFVGRFIGHLTILGMVILLTLISMWFIVYRGMDVELDLALQSSAMIYINLLLLVAPYVALMACMSTIASSARRAITFAVIFWMVASLLVNYVQSRFGFFHHADLILPGSQIQYWLRLSDWQTLDYAHIPALQTVFFLLLGGWIMRRKDL